MARMQWTLLKVAAVQILSMTFVNQTLAQSCEADYSSSVPAAISPTTTFGPVRAPDIDVSDPAHLIPAANVSLHYGSPEHKASNSSFATSSGSINMALELTHDAVILEHIDAIQSVNCTDKSVVVAFKTAAGFETALQSWSINKSLILITNHLGNCDAEFERGFFKVDTIVPNQPQRSIACSASRQQIPHIAGSCELAFSSVPASKLAKRLTLDPSFSVPFSQSLARDTVIVDEPPYLTVTANEAAFSSEITFSGHLYYDFFAFKLRRLSFDIDAGFSTDLAFTANVAAAFNKSFTYAPSELTYSLINVPGIVQLGPGIGFGLGMDINASTAVDVQAGLSVSMPDGSVHLDLLSGINSVATGWTPSYQPHANISGHADVRADATASVTVEMAVNFLSGLIDLSGGLTAKPGVANTFSLDAHPTIAVPARNSTTKIRQRSPGGGKVCDADGVSWKSEFLFSLEAFATKFWSTKLVNMGIPILEVCYPF